MSQELNTTFEELVIRDPESNELPTSQTKSNHLPIVKVKEPERKKKIQKAASQSEISTSHLQASQVFDHEERKEPLCTESTIQNRGKTKGLDTITTEKLKKVKLMATNDTRPQLTEKVTINLKTYKRYSQDTKVQALELAQQLGPSRVSVHTGIPETTIRRWSKVGIDRTGNSGRLPTFPVVEQELLKVFQAFRSVGIQQTNKSLLFESRKIADRLKQNDFVGSSSWLRGFKRRNGIVYRREDRTTFT